MSENQENNAITVDPQSSSSPLSQVHSTTNAEKENPLNSNKPVISLATKEISDVIKFQEPSTSKNYSFKTQIRINIMEDLKKSQHSFGTEDSVHLSLFDEDINKLRKDNNSIEVEESYATVDACVKEKMTNTNEPTVFSRNDRTQRIIVNNAEAPPPYDSQPPPPYNQSYGPQYQQYYVQTVRDASQGGTYFTDMDLSYSGDFVYQDIRHGFIRKVFLILALQLSLTTGMILLVMYHEPSKLFMVKNIAMFWVMAFTEMILYIVLMCYATVRRIFPLNFILLLLFTIALSYICAFSTIFYSTKIILTTAASTALICFLVTALAFQTWFDITKWSFIIGIASIIMMVFGIIVVIVSLFTYSSILWLVYSGLATLLFTVYLLYDIQCILGGRRVEISPEEYIYAALTIYVDIIMIFMYLLQIIGACSR